MVRVMLVLMATVLVGCASSQPTPARIVTDATEVSSCEYIGAALDTHYEDLARKAEELRGTHAVIVREQQLGEESGLEYVAEVYRCHVGSQR
jgi:hypothetical protein